MLFNEALKTIQIFLYLIFNIKIQKSLKKMYENVLMYQ